MRITSCFAFNSPGSDSGNCIKWVILLWRVLKPHGSHQGSENRDINPTARFAVFLGRPVNVDCRLLIPSLAEKTKLGRGTQARI